MCGITACLGQEAYLFCLKSLLQLQNRGYDSAGISFLINKNFINTKYASTDTESSLQKLESRPTEHNRSPISIGHTRWATHGLKLMLTSSSSM